MEKETSLVEQLPLLQIVGSSLLLCSLELLRASVCRACHYIKKVLFEARKKRTGKVIAVKASSQAI